MRFDILTLFPAAFDSFVTTSIIARAINEKHIEVHTHNIRDWGMGKHRQVDDVPYGGGAGMLLRPEPLWGAIHHVKGLVADDAPVIYMTPQGEPFVQQSAEKMAKAHTRIILLCGHYEGIDYRIRESLVDAELRIGNYVLTGGELPAQIIIDAVSRLKKGVLGDDMSSHEESFSPALKRKKEYPHYTRPAEFQGMVVPDVLISGHHANIQKWREENCSD